MNISVLIPCYNASRTIDATLKSVFAQTVQPDEIIVVDDGSTDGTMNRLDAYRDRISILSQPNAGVAVARTRLFQAARGEMLACLDADDIWHDRYLEAQRGMLQKHPEAVASFTGHVVVSHHGAPHWGEISSETLLKGLKYEPVPFLWNYNRFPYLFVTFSLCCARKSALADMSGEIIHSNIKVDDHYFFLRLILRGPVVRTDAKLVGYRLTNESLSSDAVKINGLTVHAYELLEVEYRERASPELMTAFRANHSSKQRTYAKTLLSAGHVRESRAQLMLALSKSSSTSARVKALGLLLISFVPRWIRPRWQSVCRPTSTEVFANRA